MASVVDAVGFVSGIFTIISFFHDGLGTPDPQGAHIQIKAGLPENLASAGEADLGGKISHVYGFDELNGYLGPSDGCSVDYNGLCQVTIDQETPGANPGYVSVANDNDATCIAWITVQPFDSNMKPGVWTGDIGANCGQSWYNNQARAGKTKDDEDYIPKCTWLNSDHTNDIASAALKFEVNAYGESVTDTQNDACAPTIWGDENGPISAQPGKRSQKARPSWMTQSLVMSNITSQPAEELCGSDTSWGPDFIGSDGYFCDMDLKTLMPLCSTKDVDGCIDVDENESTITKRMTVARRAASVAHKSYKKISKWGQ